MVYQGRRDIRILVTETVKRAINRFKDNKIVEAEELERSRMHRDAGKAFLAMGKVDRVWKIIRRCRKIEREEDAAALCFEMMESRAGEIDRQLALGTALDIAITAAKNGRHWSAVRIYERFGLVKDAEEQRRLGNLQHDNVHDYMRTLSGLQF